MRSALALTVLLAAACLPPATQPPPPPHSGEGPGVALLWALDTEQADAPMTAGMHGVLPRGLARFGADLKAQHGAVEEVRVLKDTGDKPGAWRTQELSVRYAKSAFPVFASLTFNERGELAGLSVGGAAPVSDAELDGIFASLPGSWSAAALAPERREVAYRYRAEVTQGVASQYKVLLLAQACVAVGRGQLSLEDRLTLPASVRGVPSCTLCAFEGGLNPTLRDVLHLMVATSDNTAADLLRERFGWRAVSALAERSGVAHPPPLISTQGLFALECGAGPLAQVPAAERAAYLASLSADERVAAADEAARDAFAQGPEGMVARCWRGQTDGKVADAISEVVDWPMRTDELAALYANALLGQLDSRAASRCFEEFMGHGGPGPVGLDAHFRSGGSKNGIEAGIRSLGLIYRTDRGPIAVSLSVARLAPEDRERAYQEMNNAGRALALSIYRKLGATGR